MHCCKIDSFLIVYHIGIHIDYIISDFVFDCMCENLHFSVYGNFYFYSDTLLLRIFYKNAFITATVPNRNKSIPKVRLSQI